MNGLALIIRADASVRVGTGHVMRCRSLAQEWRRRGGRVLFAAAFLTPALERQLAAEGFPLLRVAAAPGSVDDARETAALVAEHSALWVVVDGYHFGADYQCALKDAGLNVLFMDDYGHGGDYCADLVVNQNLGADRAWYARRAPNTRLLLGTDYVLLREQFQRWRGWQRKIPIRATKVLVTLGGSDPGNATGVIAAALRSLAVEIRLIVGGSNPHLPALRAELPGSSAELVVDADNMPELMAWADVAVSAGGTTAWELAFMGLPSLVMVLADNQQGVASALISHGVAQLSSPRQVAHDLQALLGDAVTRARLSEAGRRLVDGGGVARVAARLLEAALTLRRVVDADSRQIWEWANEPEARAVSLSPGPIAWETHQVWFAARCASPDCHFFLATWEGGEPIGLVRYDLCGGEAVVSINLAKQARGQGYGTALLLAGSRLCFADARVTRIRALIRPNNQASVQSFVRAGFSGAGPIEVQGQSMLQYTLRREDLA